MRAESYMVNHLKICFTNAKTQKKNTYHRKFVDNIEEGCRITFTECIAKLCQRFDSFITHIWWDSCINKIKGNEYQKRVIFKYLFSKAIDVEFF